MKYLSSMIKIIDTDKILFSLSVYLKMESKNKDSVLFRYGNKGRKFYILLSGQVTILILKETKVQMSFLRFVLHLIQLKMMKEDELVKKTIVANKSFKCHLDERIFDIFFERLVKYAIIKNQNKKMGDNNEYEEESDEESEHISENENKNKQLKEENNKRKATLQLNYLCSNSNTKNYKYKMSDVKIEENLNFDKRSSVRYPTPNRQKILDSMKISLTPSMSLYELGLPLFKKEEEMKIILSYYIYLKESLGNKKKFQISVKEYIRDTYINSIYSGAIKEEQMDNKMQFIIYLYYEIVQKNKGDTFGELALQHEDSKRTATIVTNTDCILGYLLKHDYEACLSEIELKRRKNEVNFIMSFSIFDQMNWISFENKYFNYFKREYYYQGETILKQGEPISKIFFIMDGQFEITSSLSVVTLYKIIRQKTNYSFQKLKIKLKKKLNNIRLCICNNKDILGLNDCSFYGLNGENISFINATCISNKSIAFILDISILNELQRKMSEINDNLKAIISTREKLMLDRLIAIFNQLIKSNEIDNINKSKLLKDNIYSNDKKNKGYIINNQQINYILNSNKKEENYSPYKNVLLSAKYKEARPLSKINRGNKIITLENENNILKEKINHDKRIFSSKEYRIKMNLNSFDKINNLSKENYNEDKYDIDNLKYKKRITDIMVIKESIPIKENPRIFLRSAVSIRELNEKRNIKKKLKNLYLPLNNIINKEYSHLFNWIKYTKKYTESQKEINYDQNNNNKYKENKKESEFGDNSKRLSFSSDNDNNNDKDNNLNKKEKNVNLECNKNENNENKENSIPFIIKKDKNMKIRRTLKSLMIEAKNKRKRKRKKNMKLFSKSINNTNNGKYINQNNYNIYNQTNKISLTKKINMFSSPNNNNMKYKKISNELYLKQILGTRYKNEEDKFISRTEKKLIKEINDYNLELKRKNEAKLKFIIKNKQLKKSSYMNTDFIINNYNRYKNFSYNNETDNNNSNDLLSSNNFNISKLKKNYIGNK